MSDKLRLRNPLGFQVTAFRVDDEINKPVFKSPTQDVGVPLLNEQEGVMFRGAGAAATASEQGQAPAAPAVLPGAPATPAQGQ
jgi:type IV secretion system protein VirB8